MASTRASASVVALSAGTCLWRASRPHLAVLGRLAGTKHFRNEQRFQVKTQPHRLIMRIDENRFFANSAAVLNRVEAELAPRPVTHDLLLALSFVSHLDLAVAEALKRLQVDVAARGIVLHQTEVKDPGSGPAQARGSPVRSRPPTFCPRACGDAGLGSKLCLGTEERPVA